MSGDAIVWTVAGLIPGMFVTQESRIPEEAKLEKIAAPGPDKAVSAQVPALSLTGFVRQLLRALHSPLTSSPLCFLYLNKNYSLSFQWHG